MIVGLPGAGISGLFYLACAFVMPFHGAWRAMRGSPPSREEWLRIGRSFAIAALVVAVLYASAWILAMLVSVPAPSMETGGEGNVGASGGLPEPVRALITLGIVGTIGTLALVIVSVRVLALFVHPKTAVTSQASTERPVHSVGSTPRVGRSPRVLITGGAGFIGSHIADAFVRDGWHVTVLDDLSTGDRAQVPAAAHLIVADVADPQTTDRIIEALPDLVVHAAAQISVTASVRDAERDRDVNVVGTQHVLEGSLRAGAKRFVFISSGGAVYGETTAATERSVPRPMNPYGIHKLAAEGYVRVSGLSYGILRLANVYGPRQRAGLEGGVVAIFSEAIPAGRPVTVYGKGHQTRDFVNVRDVVDAVKRASVAHADGTWNVGTGSALSINALVERIGSLAGVKPQVEHAPARPGDVESSRLLFERAWRDLAWSPAVGIDEGLRELVTVGARNEVAGAATTAATSRSRTIGATESGS